MKLNRILLIIFILLNVFYIYPKSKKIIDEKEMELLHKLRVLVAPMPFKESISYKKYKKTLNIFFNESIYEKLKGDVLFGYKYNQGVRIKKKEVYIAEVKSIELDDYTGMEALLKSTLKIYLKNKKYNITSNARYHLGICLVGRTYKDMYTHAGNQIEFYIKDIKTNRSCYYRCSQGSNRGFAKSIQLGIKYRIVDLIETLWLY
jgi:hypothetical protein